MNRKWLLVMALPLLFVGGAWAQGVPGCRWLTGVTPSTPQQKAYVDEATKLRAELWQQQAELTALEAREKPDERAVKEKLEQLSATRNKLHLLNLKNRAVVQELAGPAPGWGPAGAACPWGGPGAGRGMGPCGTGYGAGRGRGMGQGMGPGRGGRGRGWGPRW